MRMKQTTKEKLFGRTYTPTTKDVVMVLGNLEFTKEQLVNEFQSAAFRAAQNLSRIFQKRAIRTPRQIAGHGVNFWLKLPGVGRESLWILMNVLDAHGIDPLPWVAGESEDVVTLSTMARRTRLPKKAS